MGGSTRRNREHASKEWEASKKLCFETEVWLKYFTATDKTEDCGEFEKYEFKGYICTLFYWRNFSNVSVKIKLIFQCFTINIPNEMRLTLLISLSW